MLTPALYAGRFKAAQQKLIDQVKANFQKIRECKEQKTQIAECIFKYTESQLYQLSKFCSTKPVKEGFGGGGNSSSLQASGRYRQPNGGCIVENLLADISNEMKGKDEDVEGFIESSNRVIQKHDQVDKLFLANKDRQTIEVSFDQNRQLLRGFCLLFKQPVGQGPGSHSQAGGQSRSGSGQA